MNARIVAVPAFLVFIALLGCQAAQPPHSEGPGDAMATPEAAGEVEPAPPAADAPTRPSRIEPFPGLVVLPDEPAVHITSCVCIEGGWLEQIACAPRSREHESLVVTDARPSQIHAALLMAGFEPGAPGEWSFENDKLSFIPPRGAALDVFARYRDESGREIEEPIGNWIRDERGVHEFPDEPWIFAGSRIEANAEWMGPGEHYVADMTGSIIGLVTFGDEVIGFSRVIADQAAVQAPEWEVNIERIPPVGTEVTLIVRPAKPRE